MIEEVLPNLYRIEIPLPNNPLRVLNSYFIRGKERNLLIDTGFNLDVCWLAMAQALTELGVSMDNTDLFITHYHSDHIGLIGYLSTPTNTVWMSESDAQMVNANYKTNIFHTRNVNHLYHSGLLADGTPNLPEEEAVVKYASTGLVKFTMLHEGDRIDVGGYHFQCLETPGHTQGHMCLYEPDQKILISGDHVLAKITPNIGLWVLDRDALKEYLLSLEKIAALDVHLVLPAHRVLIYDLRGRVEEIKQHHARRIEDILGIVGSQKMSAAQVAKRMRWDLSYRRWDDFPINQKIHAAAEAMAHLHYLVLKGQVRMSFEEGIYYFRKEQY